MIKIMTKMKSRKATLRLSLAMLGCLALVVTNQAFAADGDMAYCHVQSISFNERALLEAEKRWDLDKSLPDIYVLAYQDNKLIALCGLPKNDRSSHSWPKSMSFEYNKKRSIEFRAYDADWLIGTSKILGKTINKSIEKARKSGHEFWASREIVKSFKKLFPKKDDKKRGRLIATVKTSRPTAGTVTLDMDAYGGKLVIQTANTEAALKDSPAPSSGRTLRLDYVTVPKFKSGKKHWDPLKGKPDLFAVLFKIEKKSSRELGRTKSVKNSFTATWQHKFRGLKPGDYEIRIYDKDAKKHDLAGKIRFAIDGQGKLVKVFKSNQIRKFKLT